MLRHTLIRRGETRLKKRVWLVFDLEPVVKVKRFMRPLQLYRGKVSQTLIKRGVGSTQSLNLHTRRARRPEPSGQSLLVSTLAKGFSDWSQGRGNVRGLKEVRTRQNATREDQRWMNVGVSRYCNSTPGDKRIMRLLKEKKKRVWN
jgi:hypothetical protein